jgi:hypothetical protein
MNHLDHLDAEQRNKTSMLYWWPKVELLEIPVPRTTFIAADSRHILSVMENGAELDSTFAAHLKDVASDFGYPVFVRTDLSSGKHGWEKTCFVSSENNLIRNTLGVCEENELGPCFMGPPYEAIVLREFIELEAPFVAFYGKLPVNRERRYFIRDGKIECHHPYWPEEAIDGHTKEPRWRELLAELNSEPPNEIEILSSYALTVGDVMEGYWSVDFAKAKNGEWYLIDMAEGDKSYHWPTCEQVQDMKLRGNNHQ